MQLSGLGSRLRERHLTVYFVLMAGSLLVGWRTFCATITLAWQNDKYTHILLILPLSLLLILVENGLLRTCGSWALWQGNSLVLAAILITCFSGIYSASLTVDMLLAFRMFALVLSWTGFLFLCFGPKALGRLMFPLLLLLGAVPLPKIALDSVIALLQIGSAWSAHAFFAAFGVPVFQQGVVLTIPGLTVHVAEECSSIRSSSMLLATAMILAQILLCSFWRRAFIVVLAIPLSVLKNGLRVFVIAMLGTRVDPGYLTGTLHHQGGVLFFTIALAVTAVLIWVLRKGEHLEPIDEDRNSTRSHYSLASD
jgi:exosortase